MRTLNFLSALKESGYNAVLSKNFTYSIDKDRRFYVVTIDSVPDKKLISLADSFGLMWVAKTYVNTENEIEYRVKFDAMPKDMTSFDFLEYKVFFNDNVNPPALLATYNDLSSAIANINLNEKLVKSIDNVDVHANAQTARIEVYEGDMVVVVDGEPELRDPVYTTEYFYNN